MNDEINQLTEQIIDAAIEVHRELGPGLLESAYQKALAHELTLRRITFVEQELCPVRYKDLMIEDAYRLDRSRERSCCRRTQDGGCADRHPRSAGTDVPQIHVLPIGPAPELQFHDAR